MSHSLPSLLRFVGQYQGADEAQGWITYACDGRVYALSATPAQVEAAKATGGRDMRVTAVRGPVGRPRLLRVDEVGHKLPTPEEASSSSIARWRAVLDRLGRRTGR